MSAVTGGERILLSGPPGNARAVVPIDAPETEAVTVRLDVGGDAQLHRAILRPVGPGSTRLTLQLPRQTPPGEYRGEMKRGDVAHALVVQVEPRPRTRISPKQSLLAVEPGSRVEFDVVVSNEGNVDVQVPKSEAFDLHDPVGQDRALGLTLRADLAEDERRVDRWFEELRRMHGGEARVTVMEGGGTLQPGDSRRIRCRLEVPMTMEPGRAYSGSWPIGSTSHIVAVEIAKPSPGTGGQRNGGRKA